MLKKKRRKRIQIVFKSEPGGFSATRPQYLFRILVSGKKIATGQPVAASLHTMSSNSCILTQSSDTSLANTLATSTTTFATPNRST